MKKKVLVGMSGGVDSSVAAYLLKEQGYDVIGVTMRLWSGGPRTADDGRKMTDGGQKAADDRREMADSGQGAAEGNRESHTESAEEDAGRVAEALRIPHHVVDFRQEFRSCVMGYFVEEYLKGRTPNPCIVCNRYIKWEALLKYALEIGADYIATGHYARVDRLRNGRYALRQSVTAKKDQTYALYQLTQEQLSHTLMPVGEYAKEDIREIAKRQGIPVADKPDSQEICFVTDNDYAGFVDREAGERVPGSGNFVTADERVLGRHKGITHYTIGQRRGLELAMGERVFVTEIRPETNEVVIGGNEGLMTDIVYCDRVNWMAVKGIEGPVRVRAKIRYNHGGEFGVIEKLADGRVKCTFASPVRAATPGQALVFYDGEYVMGGGTICKPCSGAAGK